MSNINQNTFIQGMNLDSDITQLKNTQYRHAENIRVVTNDNGTTGVLLDIEPLGRYNATIPDNETVIGTVVIDGIAFIVTFSINENGNNINRIYRFEEDHSLIKILEEDLELNSKLSIVGHSENGILKIYLTGGEKLKVIDVSGDKNYIGLVDLEFDIIPNSRLQPLNILLGYGGNLPSGKVAYCYLLFNLHGVITQISPISQIYHLSSSAVYDNSADYKGSRKDENTGKLAKLHTSLFKDTFSHARIIRILYDLINQNPKIQIVDEIGISGLSTIDYIDFGNQILAELTIEEFTANFGYDFNVSTIATLLNMLFCADVTEVSWYPEYDARAYCANDQGEVLLRGNSGDFSFKLSELDINTVPKNHDCINPWVMDIFDERDEYYFYDRDGNLGGSGVNIDYTFVTADIPLSEEQPPMKGLYATLNMNAPKVRLSQKIKFNDLYGNEVASRAAILEEDATEKLLTYANPRIAASLTGYMRDEIYRFGIIFYNEKTIATPVYWIGDIRMPNAEQSPPFVYSFEDSLTPQQLIGKALGVKFNVKNMPEGAVSYEIVRCKRTLNDRTILMQAVISNIYLCYYLDNDDAFIGSASSKYNVPMCSRSLPFICNVDNHITIHHNDNSSNTTVVYPRNVLENCYKIISSEICINGEDLLQQYSRKLKIARIGKYFSPFERSGVANSNLVFADLNTDAHSNAIYLDNQFHLYFISDSNKDRDLPYILKYFVPWYLAGEKWHDIEGLKYPNNAEYNQTLYKDLKHLNTVIGDTTYLNYSLTDFDEDRNVVMGPAGPCFVAYGDRPYIKMSIPQNHMFLQQMDTLTAADVCNIKTNNNNIYGGNSYTGKTNSTYISTNAFSSLTGEIIVYGGDIYLSILDYPNTMLFQGNTVDQYDERKAFIASYIPFESTVNMNLFLGELFSRTVGRNVRNANPYLQLKPTRIEEHIQNDPYFLYNSVYSLENTLRTFVPMSVYAESDRNFRTRIMVSQAKTDNEVIDSWTKFKIADYLDVDNLYGDITNLKVFKDKLFYFQENAVGIVSVNERSLITDGNANELVLGTGGILTRYDHITTTNGDAIRADRSIVASDNVLYWYDFNKNEICVYTGQVSLLSKEKLVQSYLNAQAKQEVVSLFDKKYNEVWFRFANNSLIFNEQLGVFTSFYTHTPDWTLYYFDKVVTIKNKQIHTINNSDELELIKYKSKIQFVVNDNVMYTKTFDNISFQGIFKDAEDNVVTTSVIDYLQFKTKHQTATIDTGENIMFDYREDTYRIPVPREDDFDENVNMSYPARMKGKCMICNCEFNEEYNFYIPYVFTTYRVSLV